MNALKPISTEYIRRFSILILLALFAWMFFYTPSDIYNIQYQNYEEMYEIKIRRGIIEPDTTLEQYIERKMQGRFWRFSPKKFTIVEVEGSAGEFLEKIASDDRGDFGSNDYYFREDELPGAFKSDLSLKEANYLSVTDEMGQKDYFCLYRPHVNAMVSRAPTAIRYPMEYYSYLLIILSILIYFFIPKLKVPEGAAYYTKFNAVYLPDILGFSLWTGAWIFFVQPDDSMPVLIRYFLLLFFGIFALAIILPTIKYASNWYLFTDKSFRWSGSGGVQSVALSDIVFLKPYKRQLPKWVGYLIILFGRGQPGATGMGILASTSAPEIGMEITTKSGERIKVMANALEADEVFTERFQELEKKVEDK